jgi:hypothetical protein
VTTPPPDTLPEMPSGIPAQSRYHRPRKVVSWTALIFGLAVGLGLGLYYTWMVNPIVEVETRPSQLNVEDRGRYVGLIALSFSHNSDLPRTLERLLDVSHSGQPFVEMAAIACERVQRGDANGNAGFREIRGMVTLYQLQGQAGCADEVVLASAPSTQEVVVVLPTPTEAPPATKTPTVAPTRFPTPTVQVVVPTPVPVAQYILLNVSTFCDAEDSGLIEVYVQDFNGSGIPGQPIRVRWDGGQDTFYTGLKPEFGAAYADFQMEDGVSYVIEMPERSEPSTQQLIANPCTTDTGGTATISYRVVFRPT